MTTGWKLGAAAAFLLLVSGLKGASADTVQLNPSKDNTLYEPPTQDQLSNGQGQHFFVGTTGTGLKRRGLIAFDIAGNIPAGSAIQRAVLQLHMSRTTSGELEVDLRPALIDWGEGASIASEEEGKGAPAQMGDATWLHTFFDTQFWTNIGGDFPSTVSANPPVSEIIVYSVDSSFYPALASDVQPWLDQPGTNFGWVVMLADESSPTTTKRFDTRENSTPAFQPVLTVTYSPTCPSP